MNWAGIEEHIDAGVLLDPCEDRPEWHLHFTADGNVRAWADESASWLDDDARRGPETIRLLRLDSRRLVESRRRAIHDVLRRLDLSGPFDADLLTPEVEHVGAIRQVLASRIAADPAGPSTRYAEMLVPELGPLVVLEPDRLQDSGSTSAP